MDEKEECEHIRNPRSPLPFVTQETLVTVVTVDQRYNFEATLRDWRLRIERENPVLGGFIEGYFTRCDGPAKALAGMLMVYESLRHQAESDALQEAMEKKP